MQKQTDWNLINQALLIIDWTDACNDATNKNKTLLELWGEKMAPIYGGERLFNTGLLMMASYMLFVYPKESELNNIDYQNIDISDFTITQQDNNNNSTPQALCRRLRNAVAHANYIVANDAITFHDHNNGSNNITFTIGTVKFGEFIHKFMQEVYTQKVLPNQQS
ncbi:MAG: HEPN family nuclease [Flavobacteriales bacterium]